MRSGCGQLPSWTSSLAWTRWRNLSGPQPLFYPACQTFPWTKHQNCSPSQTGNIFSSLSSTTHSYLSSRISSNMSQVQLIDFLTFFQSKQVVVHYEHNTATCVHLQYLNTVSSHWLMTAPLGWFMVSALLKGTITGRTNLPKVTTTVHFHIPLSSKSSINYVCFLIVKNILTKTLKWYYPNVYFFASLL